MRYDVLIIGGGPAGYTAAIYAARSNLRPILFEGPAPGGQLMITTDVENYPGFPQAVTGPELMQHFRDQAERFGTMLVTDQIERVDFSQQPFQVWDSRGNRHEARSVIVCTGAQAKWLGLESEKNLHGRGVSACATCDGFFFRGKDVAVVGGGDTALEEALFLSNLARRVYLVHRRDALRASPIMQDRARARANLEFVWNAQVEEILARSSETVTHLRLRSCQDGHTWEIPVDGVFVAIGHAPNTALFGGVLDLDEHGYIRTHDGTRTSIPGVFAAGDVQDAVYRQAITAAGTGCMAAIDAERWLASELAKSTATSARS